MDDLSFIVGLMRDNSDALGFVPGPTIERWYLRKGFYVVQTDDRGRAVGYILHGKPWRDRALRIVQHCIDYDYRLRGFGQSAFQVVVDRAKMAGVRSILLHCAVDLESNLFWRSVGFSLEDTLYPTNRRHRPINVYRESVTIPGYRESVTIPGSVCAVCGEPLIGRSHRKTCSNRCRMALSRMIR